jgi:LacI family transcriptional regulator
MLLRSRFRREDGHRVMRALLATAAPPTAVFAESDEQAIGVLRAATECGLRVPGDLAVVSFDGIPESRFTQPALTTIAQPIEELGRRAVEMAVAGPHAGARRIRLPVTLVLGGSCGCTAGRPHRVTAARATSPEIAGTKTSGRPDASHTR